MKELRTWHWLQPPLYFEIVCPQCGLKATNWSEFEGYIWCYHCEKDIDDYVSPMDGPVPIYTARLLGLDFRKVNIADGTVFDDLPHILTEEDKKRGKEFFDVEYENDI